MYEKNPIFNKNTHLCIHITWKHKHTCEHKHRYKQACIHTPNKLEIPQKYLRTVTIFLSGIWYLRVIQFLHCWLPFPIYHQNRIQSTWMLHLLLLEFLFCWTIRNERAIGLLVSLAYTCSCPRFCQVSCQKKCEGKGCVFPVLFFYCLWPQNLCLIKFWHSS